MKNLIPTLLTSVALLASSSYAMACNETKPIEVRFAKGTTSSSYTGQIIGYQYYSYHFIANKGQKLKVKIDGGNVDAYLFHDKLKDSVYMGQYSPELDAQGNYTLPYSGKYELRVLQPRSQARLGKTPKYNLKISIQ